MKNTPSKPQFRLDRIVGAVSREPQVFAVEEAARGIGRRDFLRIGTAIPAAAAMGILGAGWATAADDLIRAHRAAISFLLAAPDGTALLSGSADDVKKWDLPGGVPQGRLGRNLRGDGVWVWLAEGYRLAHATAGALSSYTFPEGVSSGVDFPTGFSQLAAMTFDGATLAISDGTGIAIASLLSNGQFQAGKKIQSNFITCLAATDTAIVSGSNDGYVRAWSIANGTPLGQFRIGSAILTMLSIPAQNAVATGHADGTINIVSLVDGKFTTLLNMKSQIRVLSIGSEGDVLVGASGDGDIRAFSLLTGDSLAVRKLDLGGGTRITAMTVLPKNNRVAVGTSSGHILLLDWPSLETRAYLFDPPANEATVRGVSYRTLDPASGRTVTFTLPCGSAIPPGATCTCNCVPGTASPTVSTPSSISSPPIRIPGGTTTLPCTPSPLPPNTICTCNCIPGR